MKGYSYSAVIAVLLMVLLIFAACTKERVYIEQHPSDIGKYCRVDSVVVHNNFLGFNFQTFQNYKFSYDQASRPLEIRIQNPGPEMIGPDLHFRYDKKGRLSDVLQTDPGQTFVYIWQRFSYPSPRIVIDSTFDYQASLNAPNPTGPQTSIQKTLQDEEGRPVKFIFIENVPNIPPDTSEVSYDRNGNLVDAGFTYDDKINIYQTNPVWQFYYNNYSRNNITAVGPGGQQATPSAYNAYGLPTQFLGPFDNVFGFSFNIMDVSYSCDVPGGGHPN
jgi:hypothetical protein